MTISAKFAGYCTKCNGAIAVGTPVSWVKGVKGVSHLTGACPAKTFTTVAPVVPAVNAAPVAKVDGALIVGFLLGAKARGLRFPKLRFLAPDGKSELRLSLAGSTSKYPGSVQVKVSENWVGRINADGSVTYGITNTAGLLATLTSVALNPAAAASAYGHLCGRCAACNLPLTDEGSVEVGYGPICAAHYGWPHKAKGTPAVKAVGAVPVLTAAERKLATWAVDAEEAEFRREHGDPEAVAERSEGGSRFKVIKSTTEDATL